MALILLCQLRAVSNMVTIVSAFYNIDSSSKAIAKASADKDAAFDSANSNYTKHEITVCRRTLRSVFVINMRLYLVLNSSKHACADTAGLYKLVQ